MWAAVYSSVDSKYKLKNSHTKLRSYLFLKSHIQEERCFKVNDKKNTLLDWVNAKSERHSAKQVTRSNAAAKNGGKDAAQKQTGIH